MLNWVAVQPQNTRCPLRSSASATALSAASASFRVEKGTMPFIRSRRSRTPNLCALLAASFPPLFPWILKFSAWRRQIPSLASFLDATSMTTFAPTHEIVKVVA
jgi:hypothetical protein